MSTPKSKEALVRLAWITELRRQGHRQCRGDYRKGEQVCALGLLAEVIGTPRAWQLPDGWVEPATGLTNSQSRQVVWMNDGGILRDQRQHTFAEIADVVAGWFPE